MFLIRSCLSKYDERSAIPGVLYFENDTCKLLIAIISYEKATSYEQDGGFIHKSVSTTYYLQSNDGITGVKRKEQKIKDHKEIKEFPIETLCSGGKLAWLFAGELMAFNPLTLEKVADVSSLENKNPLLKGKLPKQRQYYRFNTSDQSISITATDGTKWRLNTTSLIATELDEADSDPYKQAIIDAEEMENKMEARIKSFYQNNDRLKKDFYKELDQLQDLRDSLTREKYRLQSFQRNAEEKESEIETLSRFNIGYNSMKTNGDTAGHTFYGMLSAGEFKNINDQFYMRGENDETARRQLYIAEMNEDRNGTLHIDKQHPYLPKATQSFLHGGFLYNKKTALPIKLGSSYLVVHKSVIGNEGKIQLSKIDNSSGVAWTVDTQLKEWIDYQLTPQRLYIFGVSNPEISSPQINLLLIINLQSGSINRFDYFTDQSL